MTTTDATNGSKTKASAIPISEYVSFRAVRKDIFVNDADNARKSYDPDKLKGLAESIRINGLEQPPIVRPSTKEDKTDKPWTLVMGFRRMRAIDLLAWDSFDARRPAGERDRKSLHMAALAENLARDNLTPYETACGLDRSIVEYKATEAEVGAATGISRSHVGNLVRCLRRLPEDTIKAWSDPSHPAHKLATMDKLLKISALEDPNDRASMWEEVVKGVPATPAPGATPDPNAPPAGKKITARLIGKRVSSCLAFVNSKTGKEYTPPSDAAWFGAFVRYIAGHRDTPPDGLAVEPKKDDKPKKGKKRAKRTART